MHSLEAAVLDANVIIHSRGQIPVGKVYITEKVFEEIKSTSGRMVLGKLEYSKVNPSERSLDRVRDKSSEIKSPTSSEDESALALALDQDLSLVTDDKALQNLALHLEADFEGFNTDEVSEKRRWRKECDNCGNEVSDARCPSCGSHSVNRKRGQHS